MVIRLSRLTSEDLARNSLMYYIQPLAGVLNEHLSLFNPIESNGMGQSNTVSMWDALHAAGVSDHAQTEIRMILDHIRILRSEVRRTRSPRLIRQPIYIEEDVNTRWWAWLLLEYVMRPQINQISEHVKCYTFDRLTENEFGAFFQLQATNTVGQLVKVTPKFREPCMQSTHSIERSDGRTGSTQEFDLQRDPTQRKNQKVYGDIVSIMRGGGLAVLVVLVVLVVHITGGEGVHENVGLCFHSCANVTFAENLTTIMILFGS